MPCITKCRDDLAPVSRELQPLPGQALARRLGAHDQSEITEAEVDLGEMCKVVDDKPGHG